MHHFPGQAGSQVKPYIVFKANGDSSFYGEADFPCELAQPAIPIRTNPHAIQPRRGGGKFSSQNRLLVIMPQSCSRRAFCTNRLLAGIQQ